MFFATVSSLLFARARKGRCENILVDVRRPPVGACCGKHRISPVSFALGLLRIGSPPQRRNRLVEMPTKTETYIDVNVIDRSSSQNWRLRSRATSARFALTLGHRLHRVPHPAISTRRCDHEDPGEPSALGHRPAEYRCGGAMHGIGARHARGHGDQRRDRCCGRSGLARPEPDVGGSHPCRTGTTRPAPRS